MTVRPQPPSPRDGSDVTAPAGQPALVDELAVTRSDEVLLPTYDVRARFRLQAPDAAEAENALQERLHGEPFHELSVERQEPDGSFLVVARFVTVSVDAHTAVAGVSESLAAAGVTADEVWSAAQL